MSNSTRNLTTAIGVMFLLAFGYIGVVYFRQAQDIDSRNAAAEERIADFLAAVDEDETPEISIEPSVDLGFEDGAQFAVNRVPGDDYGRIVRRLASGEREFVGDIRCERFHAADEIGLCLWRSGINSFKSTLYDFSDGTDVEVERWNTRLPSRARVSRDGGFASSTVFAEGGGYQDVGGFVTVVDVFDTRKPDERLRLSEFDHSSEDAKYFDDPNSKYWGVTWGKAGEFYATWGNDEETRIIKGSFLDQTIEMTDLVGSCPSLSPDGSRLIYKKAVGEEFQLTQFDLETEVEKSVAESRSVDDQIEWLDDETIAYALHPEGSEPDEATVQPEFDVWSLIVDGGTPELYLPNADSPTSYVATDF